MLNFMKIYTLLMLCLILNFNFLDECSGQTNEPGEDAEDRGQIPFSQYMVSIRTRQPSRYFGDNHYCGGAIIDARHILTAGSCVTKASMLRLLPRDILIVAGTYKRLTPSSPSSEDTIQQIGVSRIDLQYEFTNDNNYNIAVLTLNKDLIFSKYVAKIELDDGEVPYNSSCTVLGWGRMYPKGPLPSTCVDSEINLLSQSTCRNVTKYRNFGDNVICGGSLDSNYGRPCDGDMGGPLICGQKLTGIITWVFGCKTLKYPSYFESVKFHKKFIEKSQKAGSLSIHAFQIILPITCVLVVMKSFKF